VAGAPSAATSVTDFSRRGDSRCNLYVKMHSPVGYLELMSKSYLPVPT